MLITCKHELAAAKHTGNLVEDERNEVSRILRAHASYQNFPIWGRTSEMSDDDVFKDDDEERENDAHVESMLLAQDRDHHEDENEDEDEEEDEAEVQPNYKGMKVPDLKNLAKERGIKGLSGKRKKELIELLQQHAGLRVNEELVVNAPKDQAFDRSVTWKALNTAEDYRPVPPSTVPTYSQLSEIAKRNLKVYTKRGTIVFPSPKEYYDMYEGNHEGVSLKEKMVQWTSAYVKANNFGSEVKRRFGEDGINVKIIDRMHALYILNGLLNTSSKEAATSGTIIGFHNCVLSAVGGKTKALNLLQRVFKYYIL